MPAGRPAPTAECGHAVAFAGWIPDRAAVRDAILVCDPGDNTIAEVRNVWSGDPRQLPVHFGRLRPSIVLQPAGTFTVMGAVVVVPRAGRPAGPRMTETRTRAMPDLTQDISPLWSALCGPAAAADVLFAMADRQAEVLRDFARGPGAAADEGTARLIVGNADRVARESLAGRMGFGPEGRGVTNEGIRSGLESWLEEKNPAAWETRLDWLADDAADGSRDRQREFFGRLAAAVEAGGGCVLCLWPGAEFADAAVAAPAPAQADVAATHTAGGPAARLPSPPASSPPASSPTPLPDADFPELPPARELPAGLPGRTDRRDPKTAAADAARKLREAERRQKSAPQRAFELAAEAVSILHQAAQTDPALRPQLDEALDVCRKCETRLPRARGVDRSKTTTFH